MPGPTITSSNLFSQEPSTTSLPFCATRHRDRGQLDATRRRGFLLASHGQEALQIDRWLIPARHNIDRSSIRPHARSHARRAGY